MWRTSVKALIWQLYKNSCFISSLFFDTHFFFYLINISRSHVIYICNFFLASMCSVKLRVSAQLFLLFATVIPGRISFQWRKNWNAWIFYIFILFFTHYEPLLKYNRVPSHLTAGWYVLSLTDDGNFLAYSHKTLRFLLAKQLLYI